MTKVVKVPASVTVVTAGAFADAVGDALAQHDEVALDLAEVGELDLSFLQIVTAARVHAAEQGKQLRLGSGVPETVEGLLIRAGFIDADRDFWCAGAAQ